MFKKRFLLLGVRPIGRLAPGAYNGSGNSGAKRVIRSIDRPEKEGFAEPVVIHPEGTAGNAEPSDGPDLRATHPAAAMGIADQKR